MIDIAIQPNNSASNIAVSERSKNLNRYFQFALLVAAAGAIYPLLYLRQYYENSILAAFNITSADLNSIYVVLGFVFVATYMPSGWLADKFSPKLLISFSLTVVGGTGFWYAAYPPLWQLKIIFFFWGLAAGLTFWAALVKSVKLLAKSSEQGRFFGILDGGRGLVEALLATIGLAIFAYLMAQNPAPQQALRPIIYMYSVICIAIAVLIFIFLDSETKNTDGDVQEDKKIKGNLLQDLRTVAANPRLWLMAFIILTGYQLFWGTYSFSSYLQEGYGMTAVAAGVITVTKVWMRPISSVAAGFLGDKFSNELILPLSMLLACCGYLVLVFFPHVNHAYFLLFIVIGIGTMTYAIRGLYWSILDGCKVPPHVIGLAIGIISMIGYLPDIFLPMINRAILNNYPGPLGFRIYYSYLAGAGLLGAVVAFYFKSLVNTHKNT
ncbi:MFS transporter [Glaciimonas soli]|uniref:MFS transporter n=1 Tax=Glaciimonas soli TaxID=2590999 RepID=A0A843YKH5_9BURK|nr:MFS transporter [Glaciimonas soli]MQR00319.1 MFS transporter [Glaciimonas soli]